MIKVITGDSAVFNFALVYPGAVDGVPTPDLSESTVVFAIKQKKIQIEKSIINSDTNILTFILTPEETEKLPLGAYDACCKVYYGDEATTVWMDKIIVMKGVLNANI